MSAEPSSSDEFAEDGELDLGSEPLEFLELEPPRTGEALEVAPGIRWCRIPLPLALNHINVWLVDHGDGCVVVDTGLNASVCIDAWHAIEREVLTHKPLRGVFVTHMHPDHIGLARWLQQRHGVPVWTSQRTYEVTGHLLNEDDAARELAEQFFAQHGLLDAAQRKQLVPRGFGIMLSGLPEVERFVNDAERVEWGGASWDSLEVYGHAEGHICLHNAAQGVLISGDQVLPSISPNISLTWRSGDANPLGSFLASLERLSRLPPRTLVLPAHGRPFVGLQARARDLRLHHERQLEQIEQACIEGKCAAELLPVLFRRPLVGLHVVLALSEAVAHLEHLVACGRLERVDEASSGVTRYVTTPRR